MELRGRTRHGAAVGAVRRHFDRLGDREWARQDSDATSRVSLEVHRRFLRRFVPRGAHVLEVGAGPGRFTTELAAQGCRVVATDASPAHLSAHGRRLRGTPAERGVLRRELLDVRDTSRYRDGEFDAVLAYGAPLSSTPVASCDALRGLLRILVPGGVVVASVVSLLGTWRHHLPDTGDPADATAAGCGDTDAPPPVPCRKFRWGDVVALVTEAGGTLLDGSASNWASLGDRDTLARLESDRERWRRFLEHEIAACAEPGTRDGGTHILFAVRR
ncbi:bifunctional 2-polyprenyl-6-hydroxyphenol methylase/3-demethylubiquinol 3-O-methyltransferase UbiG [Pseudonocardia sp. MH-G8]|uniref:class I SAM-dependent methyltransferase n=1 Tax=Pseudonocardia sp. MH-G8 TaxID=1854588 RepID=UPI0018EA033A|nr:methyltransferase domain-containing protein [Pseudonocardia sp. MH-G8]